MSTPTFLSDCNMKMVQSHSNFSHHLRDDSSVHHSVPGVTLNLMVPTNFFFPSRKSRVDEEIEVFDAEKYFKGALEELQMAHRIPSPRVHNSETSSGSSDSSRNSNSALVPSQPPKNGSSPELKQKNSRRTFAGCPCCGKKSVLVGSGSSFKTSSIRNQVPHDVSASSGGNWKLPSEIRLCSGRHESFSFPTVELPEEQTPTVRCSTERPRFSLEMVGSSEEEDVGPRVSRNKTLTSRRVNAFTTYSTPRDEDTTSNASSDLFELDVVSNHISTYSRRSSPTSCCAPSIASIQWSVVTATKLSAADTNSASGSGPVPGLVNLRAQEALHKRRPSLLGCHDEKAVRVVASSSTREGCAAAQLERSHVSCQPLSQSLQAPADGV